DTPELVVDPAVIARRAGLDAQHIDKVVDAITDAQADVEGFLHRTLIPVEHSFEGLTPDESYPLGDVQAWPEVQCDDEYSVVSWAATPDGLFTVQFLVGIDARQLQPIKRFVTAHAIKMLQDDPMLADAIRRPIRSVNAEGQSLTFETGSVADGAIGVAPK